MEKKRKPPTTWRTCPNCYNRATKILSINTGKYTCQICDHQYYNPKFIREEINAT